MKKNHYLLVPTFIFELKDISLTDKLILGILYTFRTKEIYLSNEYIYSLLGISERQVSRSLTKLEKLKYIKTYEKDNLRYIWKQKIEPYHYFKAENVKEFEEFNKVMAKLSLKFKKK